MCMASHKSLSLNDPVKSTPSYVRQSLSATRVISLLNAEPPEFLPPLPLVPYALSLALSVVYRHFRSRRLKVHINRATDELKQCVVLLNRLRSAWWSAGTMADLGTAVLNNADRNTRTANTPATVADVNNAHSRNLEGKTEQQLPLQPSHHPPLASSASTHHHHPQWHSTPQQSLDTSIDPRLQSHAAPPTPMSLLNPLPTSTPGQHPTSSERADRAPVPNPPTSAMMPNSNSNSNLAATPVPGHFDFSDASPDWLNFDAAFENFEGLLGSSGADLSNELFRPLHYEPMEEF